MGKIGGYAIAGIGVLALGVGIWYLYKQNPTNDTNIPSSNTDVTPPPSGNSGNNGGLGDTHPTSTDNGTSVGAGNMDYQTFIEWLKSQNSLTNTLGTGEARIPSTVDTTKPSSSDTIPDSDIYNYSGKTGGGFDIIVKATGVKAGIGSSTSPIDDHAKAVKQYSTPAGETSTVYNTGIVLTTVGSNKSPTAPSNNSNTSPTKPTNNTTVINGKVYATGSVSAKNALKKK